MAVFTSAKASFILMVMLMLMLIGVRAPPDLKGGGEGAVTFLPEKDYAMPDRVGVERGRSPFSHLMKLLSLEK